MFVIKSKKSGLFFHMLANEELLFGPIKDAATFKKPDAQTFIKLADDEDLEIEPAETNCRDCGDIFSRKALRGWRYEPNVKLCDSCYDQRDMEEDDG